MKLRINKYLVTLLITAIIGSPFLDNVVDASCHLNLIKGDKTNNYPNAPNKNIDYSIPGHPSSERDSSQGNSFCLFCIGNAVGIIGNPGFEILLLSSPFLDPLITPALSDPTFPISKPPIC